MSRTTVAVAIAVLVGGTVLWFVGIVAVGQLAGGHLFRRPREQNSLRRLPKSSESVATVARVPTPGLRRRADRRSASPRGGRSIRSDRRVPGCVLPGCRHARAHSIVRLADCFAVHADVARPPSGSNAPTTAKPGSSRSTSPTGRRSCACSRSAPRSCWSCGRRCCRKPSGGSGRGSERRPSADPWGGLTHSCHPRRRLPRLLCAAMLECDFCGCVAFHPDKGWAAYHRDDPEGSTSRASRSSVRRAPQPCTASCPRSRPRMSVQKTSAGSWQVPSRKTSSECPEELLDLRRRPRRLRSRASFAAPAHLSH